ncbi:putative forkhead-associated (FHA) domain-containing protein [Helianthus annuus]|nr:putative forkhead-associated (FHA) domain-containing protein [Helianthus annuus]KAJ0868867.1 putative forkhead-associated (FHA) domain-containing protein [Helianthus annuus]
MCIRHERLDRPLHVGPAEKLQHDVGEDYAELVRIASTKSLGNKLDYPDRIGRQQTQQSTTTQVPRSQSVAIGRIDEEGSFHYTDDFRLSSDPMFLRSRSHAVSRVHA